MSNPTTPFSWQMPTATDLVTDLPADFEVFGQAVATSMADLLGGTSGQILAKNSNTDMDFVWVANDVGDITAVTAGTGISGGGTSGAVTVTNSMATAIDAKGDLIGGTGADTFARLAVGTNGDSLIADSSTSTGLKWQGAWTSWTPAYTGLTVGNGTSTGRYQRVGNTVIAQGKLVWGSTTSASVPIYVTLPVANSSSSESVIFDTLCYDNSSAVIYIGTISLQNDIAYFYQQGSTGTWTDLTIQDGTRPFTWAVNDAMVYQVIYEV